MSKLRHRTRMEFRRRTSELLQIKQWADKVCAANGPLTRSLIQRAAKEIGRAYKYGVRELERRMYRQRKLERKTRRPAWPPDF